MGILKAGKFEMKWGKDSPTANMGSNLILPEDDLRQVVRELNDMVFPVSSMSRQTTPDYKTVAQSMGDILLISPEFQVQWLEALESLAIWNPDVSNAIENISLANTPFTTYFDESVPDSLTREMQQFLTESRDKWYPYGDGYSGFLDDILVQCAYSGAMSYEALVSNAIDGINRVEMVNPKNILFYRDAEDDGIYPIQKIPSQYLNFFKGATIMGHYKKLNTLTYRYSALRRMGENPIAIPPMLAGMESLLIRRDMEKNMKVIMEKLGVMGFLKVMMNRPEKLTGESDTQYQKRLQKAMDENIEQVRTGFKENFMMGWAKTQEIEFVSANTSAQGAEQLFDIVDRTFLTGLKQSMEMMNRKSSTSETFGRVILAKMAKQLGKYQNLLATNTNYLDLMHLRLAGYPVKKVINKHEPVLLGDKLKEQQARSMQIDNEAKLYNDGVTDQDTRANNLGYDSPDQDEPRIAAPGSEKDLALKSAAIKDKNKGNETDPTDPKTTDKNIRIRLPQNFVKVLQNEPETGMGYHVVDVFMEELVIAEDVIITHCEWMYTNTLIDTSAITKIELKKKAN